MIYIYIQCHNHLNKRFCQDYYSRIVELFHYASCYHYVCVCVYKFVHNYIPTVFTSIYEEKDLSSCEGLVMIVAKDNTFFVAKVFFCLVYYVAGPVMALQKVCSSFYHMFVSSPWYLLNIINTSLYWTKTLRSLSYINIIEIRYLTSSKYNWVIWFLFNPFSAVSVFRCQNLKDITSKDNPALKEYNNYNGRRPI